MWVGFQQEKKHTIQARSASEWTMFAAAHSLALRACNLEPRREGSPREKVWKEA